MHAPDAQVRKDSRLFVELCAAILRRGHQVKFSATGQSMRPNLQDGDTVLVAPIHATPLQSGDIALVENSEGLRVHRVTQLSEQGGVSLTCSDTGISPDPVATQFFGKVLSLSRAGRE